MTQVFSSGVVVPLCRGSFELGHAVDLEFFERHPDRRNRIRWLDAAEARQARCLHGEPPPGRYYMMAVRVISEGLFQRRFLLNGPGDGMEACSSAAFDRALIAGGAPQAESESGGRAA